MKVSKHMALAIQCLADIAGNDGIDRALRIRAAKRLIDLGVTPEQINVLSRASWNGRTPVHGHSSGGTKSRTYRSWMSMKDRCLNPRSVGYGYYGGSGIKIHPRWIGEDGFTNFLSDMGERPEGMTLDRFPNMSGNYEPGNCRWATPAMQAANRRPRRCKAT